MISRLLHLFPRHRQPGVRAINLQHFDQQTGLTSRDFDCLKRAARAAGYGRGPDDYNNYNGYFDHNGETFPSWMAELFARMPLSTERR